MIIGHECLPLSQISLAFRNELRAHLLKILFYTFLSVISWLGLPQVCSRNAIKDITHGYQSGCFDHGWANVPKWPVRYISGNFELGRKKTYFLLDLMI